MPIIIAAEKEFHLSHEEEDKLNQFKAISDFPDEDLSLIIRLLRNHGWNLEAALSRYFDGNWRENMGSVITPSQNNPVIDDSFPDSVTSIPPPPQTRATSTNNFNTPVADMSNNYNDINNNVFFFHTKRLIPSLPIVNRLPADFKSKFQLVGLTKDNVPYYTTTTTTTYGNSQNILYLLFLFIPQSIFKIVSFFWTIISKLFANGSNTTINKPKIFRLPKHPNQDTNSINLSKVLVYNDTEVSKQNLREQKLNKLKDLLRNTDDNTGHNDRIPFNEMLDICEKEFKFLLVILLGDLDIDSNNTNKFDINSQKFLSHVLVDDGVMKILDDYKDNLLVYMGSVTEIEPWLVAKNMNVKYTPECFMIGNVLNANNSLNGTLRLSVLSKLKITSPKRLQNSLKWVFDRYNAELVVSRNEQEELRVSREIKQLQEQAYQESLLKDQLKEEAKILKLQELKQKQMDELNRQNRLKVEETYKSLKWLSNCINIFKDESSNVSMNEDSNDSKKHRLATLQFRTAKGTRFVKKFDEATSLYSIYMYIGCHLFLQNDSLNINSYRQSILDKIEKLKSDEALLCFKDTASMVREENVDFTELEALVKEELMKFENMKEQNEINHDNGDEPFELEFKFELVSPFPRYQVPVEKTVTIKDVPQLWPNGSLLIEEIVDEEETSDEGSSREEQE